MSLERRLKAFESRLIDSNKPSLISLPDVDDDETVRGSNLSEITILRRESSVGNAQAFIPTQEVDPLAPAPVVDNPPQVDDALAQAVNNPPQLDDALAQAVASPPQVNNALYQAVDVTAPPQDVAPRL